MFGHYFRERRTYLSRFTTPLFNSSSVFLLYSHGSPGFEQRLDDAVSVGAYSPGCFEQSSKGGEDQEGRNGSLTMSELKSYDTRIPAPPRRGVGWPGPRR